MTVIDAHQHFWAAGTYQTSWMDKAPYAGDAAFAPIARSFAPEDLEPDLAAAGIAATVLVEAADDPRENAALLAAARRATWIAGVVGWLPLDDPEAVERGLAAVRGERRFVGVRHLINVEPDPDWIVRPAVVEGLRRVAAHGLAFDFVGILPEQLRHVPTLAARVPGLRIVIDHLAKPPIAARGWEPWATLLAHAGRAPSVFAKLSGLDAGNGDAWSSADLQRYVDHALAVFGPQRLMFGSDWPVSLLRGGYAKTWREVTATLRGLGPGETDRVLGGTAIEVYRLAVDAPDAGRATAPGAASASTR